MLLIVKLRVKSNFWKIYIVKFFLKEMMGALYNNSLDFILVAFSR